MIGDRDLTHLFLQGSTDRRIYINALSRIRSRGFRDEMSMCVANLKRVLEQKSSGVLNF